MALTVGLFLADKSAFTRSDTRPGVRDVLEPLLMAGRVATCGIVDLEVLSVLGVGRTRPRWRGCFDRCRASQSTRE